MKVSTKGRYALRVMVDIAENSKGSLIPIKDIVARQNLPHKYVESIMNTLAKSGLISGQHGKGGGYRLSRLPEEITAGEILRVMEGELTPVSCLGDNAIECPRKEECRTISMWTGLYRLINDYLDGITLAELIRQNADNYMI